MVKRAWVLLLVLALAAGLLCAVSLVAARHATVSRIDQTPWVTVFTDTFTASQPEWTITDRGTIDPTGYEWDIAAYTRTVGTDAVEDHGLWAAGGGITGSQQSWYTGTYTNNMMTLAVAGPFTLSESVADVRLSAQVLNRVATGDSLIVELSRDGKNPPAGATPVPADSDSWQTITRTAGSFHAGEAVWIYLRFVSDGSGVASGPLLDDIILEAISRFDTYLPLVRLDPTPVPTPTPTPIPVYVDDFSDPTSGWYTGWAERYGYSPVPGIQEVAEMSYDNGHYQIYIPMDFRGGGNVDTWFVWPAEMAPLPNTQPLPDRYCVEARAVFADASSDHNPWWAHWGIVFGANAARSEVYTFQINADHKVGALRLHNYTYPGNRQPFDGTEVNVEIPIVRWWDNKDNDHWSKDGFGNPSTEYNTLKVEVDGNTARFYVNGTQVASGDISGMPRDRVGVIGGSWEVTDFTIAYDYFRYDPSCSTR